MAITPTYVASGALLRSDESSRGAGPENSIGRWQLALPTRFELHAVLISRSSLSAWIERAHACRSVLRAGSISAWPCQPFQKSSVLSRSGRYVRSPAEFWHCPKHRPPTRERPDPQIAELHAAAPQTIARAPAKPPLQHAVALDITWQIHVACDAGDGGGQPFREPLPRSAAECREQQRETRSKKLALLACDGLFARAASISLSLSRSCSSFASLLSTTRTSLSLNALSRSRAGSLVFPTCPNPVSTPLHPTSRVIDLVRTVAVADPAAALDHVRHLLPQPSVARHCLVRRLSASRKARLEVPLVALPKCRRRRRRRRRRPSSSSAAAAKAPLVCSRGLELASSLRRHLQEASPTLAEQLSFDVSHSPTSHVLRCRHRRPRCSIVVVVASFVAFGAAASQAPQLGRRRTRSSIWSCSCVCVCVCICVCVCGAPRRLRRQCVDDSKRRSSTRGIEHDRQAQCRCASSRRACRPFSSPSLSAATATTIRAVSSPHSDSGHREQLDDAARRGSGVASIVGDIASVIVVSSDTVRAASSVVRESRERLLSITVLDVGRIDDDAAAVFVVGVVGSRGREPGRCVGAVRLQYV